MVTINLTSMLEKGGLNKDSGYQTAHITGGHEANL
jgi:hypothetical protein